ncbi:MAG: zf-HC2 domain-containing protein [Ignavibacteriales bacterium]|nr:zf-HC2 domain-containing protein [Ignavibacteriales bacterium]
MKQTKLHCSDVVKHICDELDQKLNSKQCREIKKHLAKCPNCTAYLDSMTKTVRLYKLQPNPSVPQKSRKKLYAVLKLHD